MPETYPVFTSALSSTPFSGTMADTSTPTPAGSLPQVPEATELPGASGDMERAKKQVANIDQTVSQLDEAMRFLQQAHYYSGSKWQKRLALGLHGKSDIEPPALMYKRFQMLNDLASTRSQYMDEKRRLIEPGPYEKAMLEQSGKDAANHLQVIERQRYLEGTNDIIRKAKAAGMIPPDTREFTPDMIAILSLNPQASANSSTGTPEDMAKRAGVLADVGRKLGPKGIQEVLPPDQQLAAMRGWETGQVEGKAASATAEAEKKYLGFKGIAPLRTAINSAYDRISDTLKEQQEVDGIVTDPLTMQRVPGKVMIRVLTPENSKKARQMALDEFPGSENVPELKNYVSGKGAPPTEQQDVTPAQKTLEQIRARKPQAK